MERIEWNDKFSVQVEDMDEHHKKLLGFFSELQNEIVLDNAPQKVEETLIALKEYSEFHFNEEVRLLKAMNYPDLAVQINQHTFFTNQVDEMYEQFKQGTLPNQSLLAFLRDWFINHIMQEDYKYGVMMKRYLEGT